MGPGGSDGEKQRSPGRPGRGLRRVPSPARPGSGHSRPATAQYRAIFRDAPVAMAVFDDQLRISRANPALATLLGLTPAVLRGRTISDLAATPRPMRLELMARKVAETGEPAVVEHRFRRPDGHEGWARTSIRRLSGGPGWCLVCVIEDVTSGREALEEQRREAEQDPLTGLLNRRGGDRRLRVALERMAMQGPVAVIVCDADRFKGVNDRFGHAAGDEVLMGMAQRLRAAVRNSDDVARMGGDEFIVVARVADACEAEAIARRCVGAVGAGAGPFAVTISAGVAVARPDGAAGPGEILAAADRALYEAKRQGGNRFCWAAGWRPPRS